VVVIDDVRQAFDNVVIEDVLQCHHQHLQDPELLSLIEVVLRGGENKTVGIDQGSAYSPTALNLLLTHIHDHPLEREGLSKPLWYRYGDNLAYLCPSVPEGHQVLNRVQTLLLDTNLTLKGQDGPPRDLWNGEGTPLLGLRLYRASNGLTLELTRKAWSQLEQHLVKAHDADDPPRAAQSAVRGWINAYGPAFREVRDDTLLHIQRLATEVGFREIGSLQDLQRWAQNSWENWQTYREKVCQESLGEDCNQSEVIEEVTAPPVTIARDDEL
jgi:hypothetical protein